MLGSSLQQIALSLPHLSSLGGVASTAVQKAHSGSFLNSASSPWAAIASSDSCCEALLQALGHKSVVFPDDAGFSSLTGEYFSLKNAELRPQCVVLPSSAHEVSTAVQTLSLGAKVFEGQCQFGIRGGGHTPFKGANNIEGGILVNLERLPSPGISPDHKTITISPSQTWDMVYEELDAYNLSTLGAKVAGVGVGGATLQCGVSYFSPRYGFICDLVENFEVVLATGDIVNANENENSDLWKALRGGGNNFGIVTAITLQTFEQGPFWGGQTFHSIDQRQTIFREHAELASAHPYDPYAHFINTIIFLNITQSWFISNSLQYTKSDPPVAVPPGVFKPFVAIPQTPVMPGAPPNTIRVDNVTAFSREYAANTLYPKRWLFAVISFAPDADFMEEFFQMTNNAMEQFFGLDGFQLVLNYQPVPSIMSERKRAVDSLGPIQTEGDLVFIHWALSYDNNERDSDEVVQDAVKELFEEAKAKAKKLGVYRSYQQPTYSDSWQNPIETRSKHTINELLAASKKYDPLQVFQKQVPGGFKLPSAWKSEL